MNMVDQGGEENQHYTDTMGVSFRPKTSLKTTGDQIRPSVRLSTATTTGTTSIIKSVRRFAADGKESATATAAPNDDLPNQQRRRKPVVKARARGPRFGLVQWQRLVRSSSDLAQRKGKPYRRNIPWEEIRKHNQPHDCWMVLRGVVYNIGPYIVYHPGGKEIFSKLELLGADGTEAYDKYHSWVSIEGLIGTLAIGTVASAATDDDPEDPFVDTRAITTIEE